MEMKQRICLLLAVLLGLSRVLPADATDDAAAYLPLAVGNSWTYSHQYLDYSATDSDFVRYSAYWDQWPGLEEPFVLPEFTIAVLNTEVIDGKTYYVISDMPANWPPAPPHFIAGKKLRWEGTYLMERTADGEQAIFRFDGANEAGYTVSTGEGDKVFKVEVRSTPPIYLFGFGGFSWGWGANFLAGYGIEAFLLIISSDDAHVFINHMAAIRAVLGGVTVEFKDALTSVASSSSWGQVKQSWLAGERRDQ